jgi:hypothetical protein
LITEEDLLRPDNIKTSKGNDETGETLFDNVATVNTSNTTASNSSIIKQQQQKERIGPLTFFPTPSLNKAEILEGKQALKPTMIKPNSCDGTVNLDTNHLTS